MGIAGRWFSETLERHRLLFGKAAVVTLVGSIVLFVLNVWQGAEFLAGKRTGFAHALATTARIGLNRAVYVPLLILSAGALIGLHIHDMRERERSTLTDVVPGESVRAEPLEPQLGPELHDLNKQYTANPIHNLWGGGRFRTLIFGLDDIGNGYDRGVSCEILSPSGERLGGAIWNELHEPKNRRRVAEEGYAVRAHEEGTYSVTWQSVGSSQYKPEIIAHEEVVLGPTGPREGWIARHEVSGDQLVLQVDPDSAERGDLYRFQCRITGPGGQFGAEDDRGIMPHPESRARFEFPREFQAPAIRDLVDGDYEVYWEAQELIVGSGRLEPVDVALDSFYVDRRGRIVDGESSE